MSSVSPLSWVSIQTHDDTIKLSEQNMHFCHLHKTLCLKRFTLKQYLIQHHLITSSELKIKLPLFNLI